MQQVIAALISAALAGASAACQPTAEPPVATAVASLQPPAAAGAPAVDSRRLHALIVGIDTYRHSAPRQPGVGFTDLQGAVGDALRFKQALAEVYGVDVDTPVPGSCDSSSAATTTLTDDCATRARILQVLEQRITSLHAGDTLLFYFAGHGARYREDRAHDQDTGYNGTILPVDARSPDGAPGDIFDIELKALKDRATAAGLYFVSVFDSCNSATATRAPAGPTGRPQREAAGPRAHTVAARADRAAPPASAAAPADASVTAAPAEQVRSAPPLAAAAPVVPAVAAGSGAGYWVHLAAAQDGEQARETTGGAGGAHAGVFTTALLETLRMPGMRDATFGDLIHEVRLRVAAHGHPGQTPSAEGALTAAMGARSRRIVLYDVQHAGTATLLQAGRTGGITAGSRFALYASQADAVARRAPVATATVTEVEAATATLALALDATPASGMPTRLVAEEVAHFLPGDSLAVVIDLPAGPARAATEAVLRATGFVRQAATGSVRVAVADAPGALALYSDDGTLLAALGSSGDAGFADALDEAVRKVARVEQLLALRTRGDSDSGADPFAIAVCIAAGSHRPTACPPLQAGGVRRIGMDERFSVTVLNRGTRPAYVYVLAIDPRHAVDLVLPKPGEFDQALVPNQPYRIANLSFDTPGAYRFVVLASAQPVRADAFAQTGIGRRTRSACGSPLERLLCASNAGRRDAGVAAVGDWSAQVSTVLALAQESTP